MELIKKMGSQRKKMRASTTTDINGIPAEKEKQSNSAGTNCNERLFAVTETKSGISQTQPEITKETKRAKRAWNKSKSQNGINCTPWRNSVISKERTWK
jgi:hypothetical protein